jgi:putative oxidoreductase
MIRLQSLFQFYLRIALALAYLKLGLDRLGFWGPNGRRFVSWGDWKHFMQYASEVMGFLPSSLVEVFAVGATVAEIVFGILLLVGKWTRFASIGSGVLTFLFAVSMAVSNGIQDPIGYSVFTVSAASFLLATIPGYKWSIDNINKAA